MSNNRKYYYLKLKDNFFDSDQMIVLESMPDGYLYSNILLKLYLRSLKYDGRLMFNERIPYNSTILASVTRHSVGVIEKAMNVFKELGLVEVLDNGAVYMLDIQNFIGKSSTEADRKRAYRLRIEEEKKQLDPPMGQMSAKCPDKYPPEIEIDLEIEREREKHPRKKTDNPKKPKKDKFGDFVLLTEEEHQKLVELMGEEKTDLYIENLNNYVGQHGRKYKSHYYTIRSWYRRDEKENKEKKQQSSPKQSNDSIYDTGFQLADGVLTPEGIIKKD